MATVNPKVKIQDTNLSEEDYIRDKYKWKTSQLIDFCEENKYPVFKAPVACFDLSFLPFTVNSLDEFIMQCKRVQDTDLKYPIIIDEHGIIANGYHRLAKAILEGKTEIDCIRMEKMPNNYERIEE